MQVDEERFLKMQEEYLQIKQTERVQDKKIKQYGSGLEGVRTPQSITGWQYARLTELCRSLS